MPGTEDTNITPCVSGSYCSAAVDSLPGIIVPEGRENSSTMLESSSSGDVGEYKIYSGLVVDGDATLEGLYTILSYEDPRNKYIIFESGSTYTDSYGNTYSIITQKLNPDNELYYDYILNIPADLIRLCRGTYVLRVYLDKKPIQVYTVTVKTDPIQGRNVNRQYTKNAYSTWIFNAAYPTKGISFISPKDAAEMLSENLKIENGKLYMRNTTNNNWYEIALQTVNGVVTLYPVTE